MSNLIYIFFISMVPLIELRGSIVVGAAMGVTWYQCMIVSIIGNMIPVPFILFFIRKILDLMKKVKILAPIAEWIERHGSKRSDRVTKYATFGLLLFVGIPLPGTGAWTGSLIAALLGIDRKKAMISVFAGILLASVIMTLAAYGFVGFLGFLT
ncbi:MAG: small multi-drug export protein [Firmicutes bacterium]|nr:small multi-drug export protein [Bacillota bacterium]